MIRRTTRGSVVAALACCGLILSAGSVSASGKRASGPQSHPAPIKGMVIDVSGTGMQVQTAGGNVGVTLSTKTHVIRILTGTTADLATGQFVEAQLATGTTTIKSLRIQGSGQHGGAPKGTKPTGSAPPKLSVGGSGRPRTGTHTGSHPASPTQQMHIEGQITSIKGNTVTLAIRHGQSATYTLGSTVTISKVMAGHLNDLSVGETVQVMTARGSNAAVEVTILNS